MIPPYIFYSKFFCSDDASRQFVQDNSGNKIMLHQTVRLVSLSDDIPKLRPANESLQLLFLIMCAENISKLHAGYSGQGDSKKHVKRFFNQFVPRDDRDKLAKGFINNSSDVPPREALQPLGFEKAVQLLYLIRCEVVHEGNYWGFNFQDGKIGMVNTDPDVIAEIKLIEIRDMIVRGSISAIRSTT